MKGRVLCSVFCTPVSQIVFGSDQRARHCAERFWRCERQVLDRGRRLKAGRSAEAQKRKQ